MHLAQFTQASAPSIESLREFLKQDDLPPYYKIKANLALSQAYGWTDPANPSKYAKERDSCCAEAKNSEMLA